MVIQTRFPQHRNAPNVSIDNNARFSFSIQTIRALEKPSFRCGAWRQWGHIVGTCSVYNVQSCLPLEISKVQYACIPYGLCWWLLFFQKGVRIRKSLWPIMQLERPALHYNTLTRLTGVWFLAGWCGWAPHACVHSKIGETVPRRCTTHTQFERLLLRVPLRLKMRGESNSYAHVLSNTSTMHIHVGALRLVTLHEATGLASARVGIVFTTWRLHTKDGGSPRLLVVRLFAFVFFEFRLLQISQRLIWDFSRSISPW